MPDAIPTRTIPGGTRRRLPSMPWLEVMAFAAMIALLASQGA